MTHWHTPSTKPLPRPWCAEDWARAQAMLADGYGYGDIAVRLGRSTRAVKAKFQKENLTPQQRQARADYARRKRAEELSTRKIAGVTFSRSARGDAAVGQALRDREARSAIAPRDLSAALFGDPLPGYSALDKKRAQA